MNNIINDNLYLHGCIHFMARRKVVLAEELHTWAVADALHSHQTNAHDCGVHVIMVSLQQCIYRNISVLSEPLLCVHFSVYVMWLYIIYYDIFRSTAFYLKGIYGSNGTSCTTFCC